MKPLSFLLAALGALTMTSHAHAELRLPTPSPKAKVFQSVGVTDISLEYSSPGVKGREIFGKLVPFGKLWRTGANSATTITFSDKVMVGGKAVPAGTYSVFSIPNKKAWTLILNKNAKQGGTRKYDAKLDAVRIELKPTAIPKRERMTFIFANTTDATTHLHLEWDKVRLAVPVTVATAALSVKNIGKATGHTSRLLANAARYYAGNKQVDKALSYINRSIAVEESWFNLYLKSQYLAEKKQYKQAIPLAEKAWKLGLKADYFFWKDQVKKSIADWKKK